MRIIGHFGHHFRESVVFLANYQGSDGFYTFLSSHLPWAAAYKYTHVPSQTSQPAGLARVLNKKVAASINGGLLLGFLVPSKYGYIYSRFK